MPHTIDHDDTTGTHGPEQLTVPAPDSAFTGSVLIQLFDEHGNLKDERRGGV